MAVLKNGKVSVQAGAGVVAESIPVNEYHECCNKARAMLKAITEGNEIK
jgi:anthranilate synthase component 1